MDLFKQRMAVPRLLAVPRLPQVLLAFSLSVFCLYSVQELAVRNIQESLTKETTVQSNHVSPDRKRENHPTAVHNPTAVHQTSQQQHMDITTMQQQQEINVDQPAAPPNQNQAEAVHTKEVNPERRARQVFITMAVCWGENAQVHGKQNFPYLEAAKRSTSLWHSLTEAQVILQIVHNGTVTPQLQQYRKNLETRGARVLLRSHGDLPCVLTAQLIRLLAFELEDIADEDVIITADVDAFIMTKDILLPLKQANKKVWIWRYELTVANGYTFMMPFIGALKSVWRSMLKYKGSLKGMVDEYGARMHLKTDYTWDVDQHIVSRAILESRVCTLPSSNPLWKEVNLEPQSFRDTECWHGSGIYEDCNNKLWTRNAIIRYEGKGCKWWHFTPDEGVLELQQKYSEIMRNRGDTGLISSLIQGVAHIKKNYIENFLSQGRQLRPDPNGELEIWDDHNP